MGETTLVGGGKNNRDVYTYPDPDKSGPPLSRGELRTCHSERSEESI